MGDGAGGSDEGADQRAVPVLLFDVMGTLVHDPFYQELPAFFGLTFEQLIADKHPTTWMEFETGRIDEATALARMFQDGRPVDQAGLRAMLRRTYRWLDGMESLLAELAVRGQPMHVLSNYPVWYRLIEEALGLSRYLPWTFVSCHTGVRKPAPEAFLGPVRQLGLQPAELMLIDDQPANCQAASRHGLAAVLFRGAQPLRAALRDRGLV